MSIDKEKAEAGGGDRPVLFGASNDPKLSGLFEALTGPHLDSVISRIESFSDDVFGEDEDEDPFPAGIVTPPPAPEAARLNPAAHEEDGTDGLDLMLDRLSEPAASDRDPAATAPRDEGVRSLTELAQIQEAQSPAAAPQRSPIADVLAGSADPSGGEEAGYLDTGLPGAGRPLAADRSAPQPDYDPLEDVDLFSEYAKDAPDEGAASDDPDFPDPDFPDEGLGDDDELDPFEDQASPDDLFLPDEEEGGSPAGSETERSYGLPEPTPYGDSGLMGGFHDDETGVADPDLEAADRLEAVVEAEPDEPDDWGASDERGPAPEADLPPASRFGRGSEPAEAAFNGSALDDLISGLSGAAATRPADPPATAGGADPNPDPETAEAPSGSVRLPAFLRRDGTGRPPLSLRTEEPVRDPAGEMPTMSVTAHEESGMTETDETEAADQPPPEGEVAVTRRGGRKRLLAGVAALALLAVIGAGAYLMLPGLTGPARVAEAPATALAPPPFEPVATGDLAGGIPDPRGADPVAAGDAPPLAPVTWPQPDPQGGETAEGAGSDLVAPVFDTAETRPEQDPPLADPSGTDSPVAEGQAPLIIGQAPDPVTDPVEGPVPGSAEPAEQAQVPAEVSDLLAELSRDVAPPAPVGVAPEVVSALEERVRGMEALRESDASREAELSNEITALTDQITGLLQRDSDQAERLERMERLIRGQSAILAQFGQMQESLEQTQVVLLDVSARIGAVEGRNPADRDAVNRALSDIEDRLQALTANMSILARMSIEGVDALRAPNASSGTAAVQTAPTPQRPGGGADTVFRSETGGFRISSDPAGRVPANVRKDDFIEGYGYVLDVLPASDGQRLVIMENGSVLVPDAD